MGTFTDYIFLVHLSPNLTQRLYLFFSYNSLSLIRTPYLYTDVGSSTEVWVNLPVSSLPKKSGSPFISNHQHQITLQLGVRP